MPTDPRLSPDDSVTAAELALGLLDGGERADALRRSLAEPAFAHEVELWRDHFATLFAVGADVAPDGGIEDRVARGIVDASPTRWWKGATIALGALAAVLVLALLLRPGAAPPPPAVIAPVEQPAPMVAAMTPTDKAKGAAAFGLVYDSARGEARMAGDVSLPAGRDAEVWTIGADGTPRSLGIMPASHILAVRAADRARLAEGITLAVSIEPSGGSPTGLPTGPVVATGKLVSA
ncbi:Anti-sigma-K factor RskA [Sphingomonas sp. EC-HK361]|uniref:anti-sigma factor n=1 Tax=Sphingomonas sp. EC-HK361 TaxID=2038397 RepID=UPI001257659D|nr:anti-sigma factor [Sphingomonas sp. EC-HK361]VVS96296.1 Anti-sigma-K factor RskA [Sphingomonas sp. EC-HK361]